MLQKLGHRGTKAQYMDTTDSIWGKKKDFSESQQWAVRDAQTREWHNNAPKQKLNSWDGETGPRRGHENRWRFEETLLFVSGGCVYWTSLCLEEDTLCSTGRYVLATAASTAGCVQVWPFLWTQPVLYFKTMPHERCGGGGFCLSHSLPKDGEKIHNY